MLTKRRQVVVSITSVLMLLIVSGCFNSSPTSSPSQRKEQPVSEKPAQMDDSSLPTSEYVKIGVPAPDKTWSGEDMAKAAQALAVLAQKDPRQLPKYKSTRSGEVLARITSSENLSTVRDKALPIQSRLLQVGLLMEYTNSIFKFYFMARRTKEVGDDDVVELMGAMLRIYVLWIENADEIISTIDKNDPSLPGRLRSVVEMKLAIVDDGQRLSTDPI